MNADYTEEDDIGKAIIDQFFTKMRLTRKQPSRRLMVNKDKVQQPPNLDNKNNAKMSTSQQRTQTQFNLHQDLTLHSTLMFNQQQKQW
eukprot:6116873-Amphidinium_carterae.1